MITIEPIPDKDIIKVTYSGIITKQDLLIHMKKITQLTFDQQRIKILEDAQDAHVSPDFNDVDMIVDYFKNYSSKRDLFAIATIQDKPLETALYTLLSENIDTPNYHFKLFALEANALLWLESF